MEFTWNGLQLASMGVEWDASDRFEELTLVPIDDVSSSDANVLSPVEDVIEPVLKFKYMTTKQDMKSNLDEIEKQLVYSMNIHLA